MTPTTITSSHPLRRPRPGRCVLTSAVVTVVGAVLALSACGSSAPGPSSDAPNGDTSSSSPTTSSPTTSAAGARTKADCSSPAILSALPKGATMEKFDCSEVGDTEWAATRVAPGHTVFFLRWNGTGWTAEDSDSVCGSTSARLPPTLSSYCRATPSSSPRPTATPTSPPPTPPATAACTSKAILAALPSGAKMQKFTCADVNGKKWAAARVEPGDTVFFLQWDGSRWNAEDSDSICGTASAGLPRSLLAYC